MPVIIKNYTWHQTNDIVIIKVPLNGIDISKVDVFTSEQYVKVNYHHYICELFLANSIIPENSKCLLNDNEATFELAKNDAELWTALEATVSKEEKQKMKELIVQSVLEQAKKEKKARAELKHALTRCCVQKQMDQDNKLRNDIDTMRKSAQDVVIQEMLEWKESEKIKEINETPIEKSIKMIKEKSKKKRQAKCVSRMQNSKLELQTQPDPQDVPLPRNTGNIDVTFTKREFPTPSREFAADMENEWIKNQVAAQRSMGFTESDLRPEEMNPTWLKGKGDEFFKTKNFKSAVNAYSSGIKLAKKMPSLYANRAAAHFNLENYHRCIDDCTTALELLTPVCESNLHARASCISRRGAALCQVGYLGQGIEEMLSALKLDPNNEELKRDIETATQKFNNVENVDTK